MRYFVAVRDKEIFKEYLYKEYGHLSVAAFEEKDRGKIYDLLLEQFFKEHPRYSSGDKILKWYYAGVLDENEVLYLVYFDKNRFYEYGVMDKSDFFKAIETENAEMIKIADKAASIREKYDANTIVRKRSYIAGYKKFSYFDVDAGVEIPFRMKECKGEGKKPLFIYLHGAGCLGNDNMKQFAEFCTVGIDIKEDCFVLLPQCDNLTCDNLSTINVFAKALRRLVGQLEETYPIDADRIYVTGISHGGACTWYSLYDNPGFYAAAIPLMGYFPDGDSDTFDVDAFKGAKIWAGHAKDDDVVPSDSDVKVCGRLKDVCDVRLSLYQKGGHKMMKKFYAGEKWQEWLFDQKR